MSGLLTIFAHPDDESLACGGIIIRCSEAGVPVDVVCVTRGEASPLTQQGSDSVAATRSRELHDAAAVLGVRNVFLLDYPDGGLPWLDAELGSRLEADITAIVRRERPEAVITFGEDGLYWHPDHIALHERTIAAVTALEAEAPAIYYVTIPAGAMRALVNDVPPHDARRRDILGIDDPDAFGALAAPPDLIVDVGAVAARKLAALRCHRSQVAGGPLDRISDDQASTFLGIEHLRRAPFGPPGPTLLDRLVS